MEYCEGNRIDDLESLKNNKINVNKVITIKKFTSRKFKLTISTLS